MDKNANNYRHGDSHTRFHDIWRDMKGRCNSPSKTSYKNYGARGIRVSEDWKTYENFKADMYSAYLEHIKLFGEGSTTIDRIDVNGNYCKENCQWADYFKQGSNKRNTHYIASGGKVMSLEQWARENKLDSKLIHNRIHRLGWSAEDAITKPKRKFTWQ